MKAWDFDGPYYSHDLSSLIAKRGNCLESTLSAPYKYLEIETTDGIHLGWVNLSHQKDHPHISEIGIVIVEDNYWNLGLGTEAFILWINYIFEAWELTRIGFSTWSGNERMIAVGKKLGFIEEARIRKARVVKEKFYDSIKMGILKEEWNH